MRSGLFIAGAALAAVLFWSVFGSPVQAQETQSQAAPSEQGFNVLEVIEALGIVTISLVVCAALTGLFMKRKRKVLLPIHRALALLGVVSGVTHGTLVLIFF